MQGVLALLAEQRIEKKRQCESRLHGTPISCTASPSRAERKWKSTDELVADHCLATTRRVVQQSVAATVLLEDACQAVFEFFAAALHLGSDHNRPNW
jgi:hypothetical protein